MVRPPPPSPTSLLPTPLRFLDTVPSTVMRLRYRYSVVVHSDRRLPPWVRLRVSLKGKDLPRLFLVRPVQEFPDSRPSKGSVRRSGSFIPFHPCTQSLDSVVRSWTDLRLRSSTTRGPTNLEWGIEGDRTLFLVRVQLRPSTPGVPFVLIFVPSELFVIQLWPRLSISSNSRKFYRQSGSDPRYLSGSFR